MLLILLSAYVADCDAQVVKEHEISIEQWKTVSNALNFPESFPNFIVYNPDGECHASQEPSKEWSASALSPPEQVERDSDCKSFISDGIGSTTGKSTDKWTVRLNILGYDFCDACVHVEKELRAWVNEDPESRQLSIARIYGPEHFTNADEEQP